MCNGYILKVFVEVTPNQPLSTGFLSQARQSSLSYGRLSTKTRSFGNYIIDKRLMIELF
ncbi:MAG: hypothetical protein QXJ64_09830 [Thermosphaera sp.]